MKRRIVCILLAALLLLGLCCTAFAEAPATEPQLWNITDTVGLLTSDEDQSLEERAEEISAQYGVGIYLLILEDYSEYYDDPYETAYELYHQNTLGLGEDRDGVILLMSMSNRKYATFFYGPKAEYAFDAYGQELMEEEFLDDFRDDDWYDGFEDYLEVCDEYLARAEAGDPVRRRRFFGGRLRRQRHRDDDPCLPGHFCGDRDDRLPDPAGQDEVRPQGHARRCLRRGQPEPDGQPRPVYAHHRDAHEDRARIV